MLEAAVLATLLLGAIPFAAKAATCDEDSISEVGSDGSIIVMMSGSVYEVLPGDEIDSMLWLPAEDVMVCARTFIYRGRAMSYYEIINTDEAEKVDATRVR